MPKRQIHFVCGKGGVGKSTVACAMALHFRDQGKRVLLAQVHAADSHAQLLEIDAVPDDVVESEPDLFVVNTDPEQALHEYALMTLKFEALYKAAFNNRFTRIFLRFVPSIAELNMLGKLWHHCEEKDGDRYRFDHVVVDCPSTGHGLAFLRVAQVLSDVMRTGPAAEKTKAMRATFEDQNRAALHVVTLAEEMPVNETVDFVSQVDITQVAPMGFVHINRILPNELSAFDLGDDGPAYIKNRLAREHMQKEQLARLGLSIPTLPKVILPAVPGTRFGRSAIEELSTRIFSVSP